MKKNSISEFELERQELKIRLKRGVTSAAPLIQMDDVPAYPAIAVSPAVATAIAPAAVAAPSAGGEIEVKSPMIGTFYRSPSPESAPYIEVGAEVTAESVVCIIEAMKVMNEIKAEVKGVITQVLVDNAKPVEFGQPLFKVRPS